MDVTPTRSVVLELKDERRAMHEGYVFLDEKCLLLAGKCARTRASPTCSARFWLDGMPPVRVAAAVARHDLGPQVYPPAVRATWADAAIADGVAPQEALRSGAAAPPAVDRSPEAEDCRRAFAHLLEMDRRRGRRRPRAAVAEYRRACASESVAGRAVARRPRRLRSRRGSRN
jgi:hypothetical protein